MTASTPFSIAETTPQDTDVASAFPTTERTYRDTVETWLLAISSNYGYVRTPSLTTTQRNSETNWAVGNMVYNTTLARLQSVSSIGPVVWVDAMGAGDTFPSGTRMPFQQTSAPTGWVKESSATYNDATVRIVTGTAGTGGSTAFSSVFTARTVAQANLPNVNFTITATSADHRHFEFANVSNGTTETVDNANSPKVEQSGGAAQNYKIGSGAGTDATIGRSSASGALTVTGTAASGGAGTALDFAVKFADFIIAQKD